MRRALSENEPVAPKSNHERVVPLGPRLAGLLAPALRGKLPAVRIVVNGKGATPSRQSVYTALSNLQERHGLPHWSFHAIRHSFCSRPVQAGASVEAVRELAGHSKLHTTQRYVHASGDDLRDAINRLNRDR